MASQSQSLLRSQPDSAAALRLAEAVESYMTRLQAGEPVDPAVFAGARPEHAEILARLLPTLDLLDLLRSSSADASQPETLGDFQILREAGRGGMGVVYEARQVSLDRRVALKVLPFAAALDPDRLQRFETEAKAAARLHHSHIAPVFSVGCEAGVHFYAMQFIDGRSLKAEIDERRRARILGLSIDDARRVARLGVQAAEALDHAHHRGIIHRDVKPANILLDADDNAWMTDFGLARSRDDPGLTMTGDVLGTLRYMSPEQARGGRGIVDHRTDVYSLGATLYEMLTLRPAADAAERPELLRQVLEADPVAPRSRNRMIPRDLETIVMKAMARDVQTRYPTARDLADDLRRFLDHRPIQARRPRLWTRAGKWARRHRDVAASTILALGVIVAAGAIVAGQRRDRERVEREMGERIARQAREADRLERLARSSRYAETVRTAAELIERDRLVEGRETLAAVIPKQGEEDLRSFPWRYLQRLADPRPRELAGHRDQPVGRRDAYRVEFSPRGDRLLSTGQQGLIRLWDVATGRLLKELEGHAGDVDWATFSPDGGRVASGGDDGTIRIWDLADAGQSIVLGRHGGVVHSVVFTPDGRRLISGGRDGLVRIWDLDEAREVARLPGLGGIVSPDGRSLASVAVDGSIELRDSKTLAVRLRITGHRDFVRCLAFDREGRRLASASADRTAAVWDVGDGRRLATCEGHVDGLEAVAFAPDGRSLATSGNDGTVRLWDAATGDPVDVFHHGDPRVWSAAFAPDGRAIASGCHDGGVRIWNASAHQERLALSLPFSDVLSAVVPEGTSRLVAAGFRAGVGPQFITTASWDLRDGKQIDFRSFRSPVGFENVHLSADGLHLGTVETGGVLSVWDLAAGRRERTTTIPTRGGWAGIVAMDRRGMLVSYVHDRKTVATASWFQDHAILIPDAPRIDGEALALDSGRYLFNTSNGLATWDPATGTIGPRPAPAESRKTIGGLLAFSSSSDLVVARDSADAGVVDLLAGRSPRAPGGPLDLGPDGRWIHAAAFSPDGRVLAVAGGKRLVKLWDLPTRRELLTLQGASGSTRFLTFTPDGSRLVNLASDGHASSAVVW